MGVTLKFLGASGTVTGSQYLLATDTSQILIDCGMFQGERELRARNWVAPPIDLATVDAVLLTHAHIDHVGLLPRHWANGLKCPIYATGATLDLCRLLLPDAGRLNEEEAEYRALEGRSRHQSPLPLFTEANAVAVLKQFQVVGFNQSVDVASGITASWTRTGHILGAGAITLDVDGLRIVFSGDVGRYGVPILRDPEPTPLGDVLVIESTYGDKDHPSSDGTDGSLEEELTRIVQETVARGGMLLVPAFAVGRTQLVLYYLAELERRGKIPSLPVVVDSPMAADATGVYRAHPDDYDENTLGILSRDSHPFSPEKVYFVRSREESKALNNITDPMILISASGMLTGGRILHHLKHRIGSPLTTLLFVGFQAPGSRGAWIKSGAKTMRLFGQEVDIRARVEQISGLSGHAGKGELLRWVDDCIGVTKEQSLPKQCFVTHGEPEVARAFAKTLSQRYEMSVKVPQHSEVVKIR